MFNGTGNSGNAAQLPLESKKIDLSLEWYYAEGSYASLGYLRKLIKNFVGLETTLQPPCQMHSPIGGAYWNEALSVGGCQSGDVGYIRSYIFANHDGAPGVDTGNDIEPPLFEVFAFIRRHDSPLSTATRVLMTKMRAHIERIQRTYARFGDGFVPPG